jgi:drug/metabolite transporter (DMT)-like permease
MFGSSTIVFTIILSFTGKLKLLFKLGIKEWVTLVLIGIPCYLYYIFYIVALNMIPVIEASMLNYMYPVFLVILAGFFYKEKFTFTKLSSIVLGFIGMLLIVLNGNFNEIRFTNLTGDLFALGGAFCWALFSNLGKMNRADPVISNYVYTFVGFVLSVAVLPFFSNFVVPDLPALAWVSWLGISNIVLSFYLWFRMLRSTSSSLVANLSFLTPFVTLLFIVVLFDEALSWPQMQGFGLIAFGIAVQTLFSIKK